jgi:hypothetical protein
MARATTRSAVTATQKSRDSHLQRRALTISTRAQPVIIASSDCAFP